MRTGFPDSLLVRQIDVLLLEGLMRLVLEDAQLTFRLEACLAYLFQLILALEPQIHLQGIRVHPFLLQTLPADIPLLNKQGRWRRDKIMNTLAFRTGIANQHMDYDQCSNAH